MNKNVPQIFKVFFIASLIFSSQYFSPNLAIADEPALEIDSSGHLGVGKDPSSNYQMDINGTTRSDYFIGDGSQLSSTGPWTISGSHISYVGNVSVGDSSNRDNKLFVSGTNQSIGVGGYLSSGQSTGIQFLDFSYGRNAGFRWSSGTSGNLYLEDASVSNYPNNWHSSSYPVNLKLTNGSVDAKSFCDENAANCIDSDKSLKVLNNITNKNPMVQTCTVAKTSSSGTSSAGLGNWDICFLSRVKIAGAGSDSNDSGDCQVKYNSGNWSVQAVSGNSGVNNLTCQAMCMNYDGTIPSAFGQDGQCSISN